jgi:hypothetical protein
VAEIVLAVIAVVFQRVARFICHAPAGSRPLHEAVHRALVDAHVRDPTARLDFALHRLPALQDVDPQGGMGGMERQVTDKTKPMMPARGSVMTLLRGHATGLLRLGHLREHKGVSPGFDAQTIPHVMLVSRGNRRGMRAHAVCGDPHLAGGVILNETW